MKFHLVMTEELWQLSAFSLLSSVLFGVGSWLLSFWLDLAKDLALSTGVNAETLIKWEMIDRGALIGAIVFYVFAVIFVVLGGFKVGGILKRTVFRDLKP